MMNHGLWRIQCFKIFWPTNQPGFLLEHSRDLNATNGWSAVTNAPGIVGISYFVTNSITGDSQFFRLRKQ